MIDMHVAGPVWCGVREEDNRGWPSVRRAWAQEADPPYRWGRGLGLRVGARTLMAGLVIRRAAKPPVREVGDWSGTTEEEDALIT